MFNQNISIDAIMGNSEVLCWAAKWLGDDEAMFLSKDMVSKKQMIREMHDLLDEADAVVTYNGNNFDLKILNKEFALLGFTPPAPYKSIDLLRTVRKNFRFTSNKLDFVCQQMGLGKKAKSARGYQLWLDCMAGDKTAWAEMEIYNLQDVFLLEDLYHTLLPWIANHPNHNLDHEEIVCTNCSSHRYQWRGWAYTKTLKYRRAQCKDCGTWLRSAKAEPRDKDHPTKLVQL